jgi:hypothetical protein
MKELKANYSQLLQLEQEKTATLDKECNEYALTNSPTPFQIIPLLRHFKVHIECVEKD